uniref:Uncharacterized protein n=1 Tax=Zea mays TaxID=4577 RepID=B6T9M9_MAIZE|nr:hypothetical protein [Zea mays]ACG34363.1 hypothetical protein [Zea mays]ACG47043.1 hypothetical protein [Zea mays]
MWNVNLGALVVLVMREEKRPLPWSHTSPRLEDYTHQVSTSKPLWILRFNK